MGEKDWYMNLPNDVVVGMVNTIAAGRGNARPSYTRHSHALTMDGYRADVDLVLTFLRAAGYAVVSTADLSALVDAVVPFILARKGVSDGTV